LDGTEGIVILNPSLRDIKEYESKRSNLLAEEEELSSLRDLEASTKDGKVIELTANIELPIEVESVLQGGADGVGLYRSEFLFLTREDMPSEEEQYQAYHYMAERMAPRPVTIRTLDAGGDKLVSSLKVVGEANPYLGWRSIRLSLRNPALFKVQLRAIIRASAGKNMRVMFPMISRIDELREAKAILAEARSEVEAAGLPFDPDMPVGCMIEVPSAVLLADELAREVDFFSIGTNDLVQFTLAVDRANERIAEWFEPMNPAIFRQVKKVVEAGRRHGIPVAVCGEMGGSPMSALVFVGLGIDSLSMGPGALLEMKRVIRNITFSEARTAARDILMADTAREVIFRLQEIFQEKLQRVGVRLPQA
jgi:phosphotransferase system enzyme I (PtsI)